MIELENLNRRFKKLSNIKKLKEFTTLSFCQSNSFLLVYILPCYFHPLQKLLNFLFKVSIFNKISDSDFISTERTSFVLLYPLDNMKLFKVVVTTFALYWIPHYLLRDGTFVSSLIKDFLCILIKFMLLQNLTLLFFTSKSY